MHIVHTIGTPPYHGRMYFPMTSWIWKRRKAPRNTVMPKIVTIARDGVGITLSSPSRATCSRRGDRTIMRPTRTVKVTSREASMKLGICVPHYGRPIEVDRMLSVVRHAEEAGLDSVWVTDHVIVPRDVDVIYREHMLDPLAVLPWLAAVTERVSLGTSVVILPYRSPVPVAKLLASVDVLSGGRLIVGVAIGWLEGEFDALGVPFKERASRTDEALELFRTLWTEEQPTLTTQH